MDAPTVPESSLFLLLLSANVDADLTDGELTEAEEELILNCATKWAFYDEFYSQEQLEAAIEKYQTFKNACADENDFIEKCAEVLLVSSHHRDVTFYLCSEILFLNGRIAEDSREEDLDVKLQRILKLDPAVSDFIFGMEVFKANLNA